MYNFPFNTKATVYILATVGIYPDTNNAYRCEVQEPGKTYRVDFAPKAEVDLGNVLQTMLDQKQIDILLPYLKALKAEGYHEADINAAESAAGESL